MESLDSVKENRAHQQQQNLYFYFRELKSLFNQTLKGTIYFLI